MDPPASARNVLDREFLEIRAKTLELAASLDRLDRAGGSVSEDPRLRQLQQAMQVIAQREGDRAEHVLLTFSRPYDPDWAAQLGVRPPGRD